MKLEEHHVEVQSNMVFERSVPIGISPEAMALVIERLIEAYPNPYLAALREYTSNAYDEHITAGVTRPVEVSLPSALSPVLRVQDFGRGLTAKELEGYGTIGESTTRDSNETTGGFGMGSKCALAASAQFTVVSVKNGKRNTVVVARDKDNVPHMNFLAEKDTTDPSGTTVIVPIADVSKFGDLTDFWVGWKPGSILVDDEQPKRSIHNPDQFREMKGGIAYNDLSNIASGRDMVRVVINQVYYTMDYKDLGITYNQREILKYYVIRIDNGSVKLAPSRESLVFNARTMEAVSKRMAQVLGLAGDAYRDSVQNAPTLKEALILLERMRRNGYPTTGLRWQGRALVLPGSVIKDNNVPDPVGTWCAPHKDHKTKSGFRVEKTYRLLSHQQPWTWDENYTRFVLVHSAGGTVTYGRGGRLKAHTEANAVGDWLTAFPVSTYTGHQVFITSEPLDKINRVYRELANVIISAEEFNATVAKVRAERAREAKAVAEAKRAEQKLRILTGSYYGTPESAEHSVAFITEKFKHVILLRNQATGIAGRARESLMTRVNYSSDVSNGALTLAKKYEAALILLNKNDDISDVMALLPPETTFEDLAIRRINETVVQTTVWERMAIRDRGKFSKLGNLANSMQDHHIDAIKSKKTRAFFRAVRDFHDQNAEVRDNMRWISSRSQRVQDAFDTFLNANGGTETLPTTPYTRYPLLEATNSYQTRSKDVIDYINMADKAAK